MQQGRTDFIPKKHGFKFQNSFEFPTLLNNYFPLKLPIPIKLGDLVYGLCGGMCFAAADYFHKKKPIPTYTDVDDINLNFFMYLWDRQLDSLSLSLVKKLSQWMLRPDLSLARSIKRWEIPKLQSMINQKQPSVLALVRVMGISDPTKNHQVLATGYDIDDDNRMTIYIYDPNYPGEEHKISMDLSQPSQGLDLTHSEDGPFRGFFLIDYKQETPS